MVGRQTVVHDDSDEALAGEEGRDVQVEALVSTGEAAAGHEQHRRPPVAVGGADVELLARVVAVGDVIVPGAARRHLEVAPVREQRAAAVGDRRVGYRAHFQEPPGEGGVETERGSEC